MCQKVSQETQLKDQRIKTLEAEVDRLGSELDKVKAEKDGKMNELEANIERRVDQLKRYKAKSHNI